MYVPFCLKKFGCNTNLNSPQAIMSVRPCPVLLKTSGTLLGKNPSSGLRCKDENIASIKTTHATKILWVVLSPIYNMHVMASLWKPSLTHSHDRRKFICFNSGLNPTAHILWVCDKMCMRQQTFK